LTLPKISLKEQAEAEAFNEEMALEQCGDEEFLVEMLEEQLGSRVSCSRCVHVFCAFAKSCSLVFRMKS